MRVGSLGAEVGHAERPLEAAGSRQDLGPDRADRPGGQRPRVQAGEFVEDLLLALGDEDRLAGLSLRAADLERELRPLAEQPEELAVDFIDTCSPFIQTHQISRRGASKSPHSIGQGQARRKQAPARGGPERGLPREGDDRRIERSGNRASTRERPAGRLAA